MTPVQIILLLFFLFAVIKVVNRFRKKQLSLSRLILWIIFWLCAGVVVVQPNSTAYFADLLGVGRGADLVVYLSLAILFFINFQLYTKLEKAEREISKLTGELAIKKVEKEL